MPDRYFFVRSQETINGVVYLPGISYRIHGKDEFKLHELRAKGNVVFTENPRDFSGYAAPFGAKINLDDASKQAHESTVVAKTARKVAKDRKEEKNTEEGSLP